MEGFTYLFTIKQASHIRNKCVVQTQVCPLLVDIEMNISSSNPGALLAHSCYPGASLAHRNV